MKTIHRILGIGLCLTSALLPACGESEGVDDAEAQGALESESQAGLAPNADNEIGSFPWTKRTGGYLGDYRSPDFQQFVLKGVWNSGHTALATLWPGLIGDNTYMGIGAIPGAEYLDSHVVREFVRELPNNLLVPPST